MADTGVFLESVLESDQGEQYGQDSDTAENEAAEAKGLSSGTGGDAAIGSAEIVTLKLYGTILRKAGFGAARKPIEYLISL